MDSLKNMNEALVYIEENLTNDIDFKEVARLALCSVYHFQRMFSFLAGVTLSEYIRRRRLSLAAFELNDSNTRIIDVAIKYGYSSADSFTRAFQSLHGITPSEARSNGQLLKAYPRMTFQLSIRGGSVMNYRIEEKGELDHYIGVATTKECPEDLVQLEVPALTWAVFEVVGPFPNTLQDVWGRVYSEWLPSSNYELAEGPELLWNENKDITSPNFRSEIWIPVLKK